MLNNNIFYHGITRKVIVAFGSLFSNIRVQRKGPTTADNQTINVPIAYAPKEKWIVRLDQDANLNNNTYVTLPRMSFEITGINYDASRKTNRMSYITCGTPGADTVKRMYAPVPYNIDVSLYILSKTQEDALQIVEQIVPYFTPEYTLSIRAVPQSNVINDIPIILQGVSIQDDYDGDFETRRFITYTLTFTLKANMYGPVIDGKMITTTLVDVADLDENVITSYDADGNKTTGNITEQWTDV
jgi:hypothetical protein